MDPLPAQAGRLRHRNNGASGDDKRQLNPIRKSPLLQLSNIYANIHLQFNKPSH